MSPGSPARTVGRLLTAGLALASGAYAAYVALAWARYGRPSRRSGDADALQDLLELFMPVYEVAARHHIHVHAPAAVTLAAARELQLLHSPVVRGIIRGRELILGAAPDDRPRPKGLLAEAQALGWAVLAEVPDREVVVGAVTKPWEANVIFRAIPPEEFAAFQEPEYVKIVWTLRADAVGPNESVFSTETRVVSTDVAARAKFRRYWSFFSPGMDLIRRVSLRPLKREAERRARATS